MTARRPIFNLCRIALCAAALTVPASWAQTRTNSPLGPSAPGSAGIDQPRAVPYGSNPSLVSAMSRGAANATAGTGISPPPRPAAVATAAPPAKPVVDPIRSSSSASNAQVGALGLDESIYGAPGTAVVISLPDPVIRPEVTSTVQVSNHDVNRIACNGAVGDVFWSEERPVKISTADNNIFVKFLIQKTGEHFSFVTDPVDLHIVCDNSIYTVVLRPESIPSVTVRLQSGVSPVTKKLAKEWGALAIEDKVQRLTRYVFVDELPEGFHRKALAESDARRHLQVVDRSTPQPTTVSGVRVIGVDDIVADGTGLRATEYQIQSDQARELRETDFLNPAMGSIVGVTIDPLRIPAGGAARLIVVTRSVANVD